MLEIEEYYKLTPCWDFQYRKLQLTFVIEVYPFCVEGSSLIWTNLLLGYIPRTQVCIPRNYFITFYIYSARSVALPRSTLDFGRSLHLDVIILRLVLWRNMACAVSRMPVAMFRKLFWNSRKGNICPALATIDCEHTLSHAESVVLQYEV